ncbi:hypothetical protein PR048_021315 [Dryococelus australis]|uniref:Mutator-like transposase domain-containing protein n=1 Tax=Dryococelus australis TaxID=614101 RepID=A0ABQ9GXX4_9NEOP|nr:hypothetical protein PR048_021315 [Dryococelus australis]
MVPVRETRRGLILFKCKTCNIESFVWLNPRGKHDSIIVSGTAVPGTLSSGGGHAQLEEITSTLNIPALSCTTFQKYYKKFSDDWEQTAFSEMEKLYNLKLREQ